MDQGFDRRNDDRKRRGFAGGTVRRYKEKNRADSYPDSEYKMHLNYFISGILVKYEPHQQNGPHTIVFVSF